MIAGAGKLSTLSPYLRPAIEALVAFADSQGVDVTVVSTFRTIEDQRRAATQARAAGRPAAAPGRSAHNYGLAVDLVGGGSSASTDHTWLMNVWLAMGGGAFYKDDRPHFEHPDWREIRKYLR